MAGLIGVLVLGCIIASLFFLVAIIAASPFWALMWLGLMIWGTARLWRSLPTCVRYSKTRR